MSELRAKSLLLTGYLEHLLTTAYPRPAADDLSQEKQRPYVEIITPTDPQQRGNQLSVMFSVPITMVFEELKKRAVVVSINIVMQHFINTSATGLDTSQ